MSADIQLAFSVLLLMVLPILTVGLPTPASSHRLVACLLGASRLCLVDINHRTHPSEVTGSLILDIGSCFSGVVPPSLVSVL